MMNFFLLANYRVTEAKENHFKIFPDKYLREFRLINLLFHKLWTFTFDHQSTCRVFAQLNHHVDKLFFRKKLLQDQVELLTFCELRQRNFLINSIIFRRALCWVKLNSSTSWTTGPESERKISIHNERLYATERLLSLWMSRYAFFYKLTFSFNIFSSVFCERKTFFLIALAIFSQCWWCSG